MLFDKPSPFRLPSSEASEDGGNSSREMTAVEGEEPATDEPYAKLIYRALMSKPNHSMVLQEIYQWFRENTVKGQFGYERLDEQHSPQLVHECGTILHATILLALL
jgi:hypothetical protein